MKLDNLSPLELECYEEWNSADEQGGDCQTIGRAWAAWRPTIDGTEPGVIIIEDDQGFVDAESYETDYAFDTQVKALQAEDAEFDAVRVWDGNYGVSIEFLNGDEASISGSGQQDENVQALLRVDYIRAQFEMPFRTIDPESVRKELAEYGAWDDEELADDAQNRARILWVAGCAVAEGNV